MLGDPIIGDNIHNLFLSVRRSVSVPLAPDIKTSTSKSHSSMNKNV